MEFPYIMVRWRIDGLTCMKKAAARKFSTAALNKISSEVAKSRQNHRPSLFGASELNNRYSTLSLGRMVLYEYVSPSVSQGGRAGAARGVREREWIFHGGTGTWTCVTYGWSAQNVRCEDVWVYKLIGNEP